MYSWGMLFLVLMWLAFCDIVTGQGNRRAYISFTVCGLFAAYTHYFSCLGAGYLYLVLFIYCLTKEQEAEILAGMQCGDSHMLSPLAPRSMEADEWRTGRILD